MASKRWSVILTGFIWSATASSFAIFFRPWCYSCAAQKEQEKSLRYHRVLKRILTLLRDWRHPRTRNHGSNPVARTSTLISSSRPSRSCGFTDEAMKMGGRRRSRQGRENWIVWFQDTERHKGLLSWLVEEGYIVRNPPGNLQQIS